MIMTFLFWKINIMWIYIELCENEWKSKELLNQTYIYAYKYCYIPKSILKVTRPEIHVSHKVICNHFIG